MLPRSNMAAARCAVWAWGSISSIPAFYTDVTDNYRLGRWARVRTDLGGFYFNLIFNLALMGVYLLTRQAFLLLAVLLRTSISCISACRLCGWMATGHWRI